MLWVVVFQGLFGTVISGPYATVARASGAGFSAYGSASAGNRWYVRPVVSR